MQRRTVCRAVLRGWAPERAVVAERGGAGARVMYRAGGGGAFAGKRGNEHGGAEQGDPLAPQPRPGRYRAGFDGDGAPVRVHDPRRDLVGAGVLGLTGRPRLGGMIGSAAVIATREPVVAVGPHTAATHPR